MSNPPAVTDLALIQAVGHDTNIAGAITPPSIKGFDYFPGYTFAVDVLLRVLNTSGVPWWLADRATGYGAGGYGAGPYGEPANIGEYGALRYGRAKYGTGGYT